MEKVNILDTRAQIFKMGSIYLEGVAAHPGFNCNSGDFTIGDTVAGMELRWIQMGNLLVADRCVCLGISWETLDFGGYIFGRPIHIDGKAYLCRSLKVGTEKKKTFSEWNELLKIESANSLIHWKNCYSWGQETPDGFPKSREARGGYSAHSWAHCLADRHEPDMGFRPVLEPLIPSISDVSIGSNIKVYGSRGQMIEGILTGFTEYDLAMRAEPSDADMSGWAVRYGEEIIVNRLALVGIGESTK